MKEDFRIGIISFILDLLFSFFFVILMFNAVFYIIVKAENRNITYLKKFNRQQRKGNTTVQNKRWKVKGTTNNQEINILLQN